MGVCTVDEQRSQQKMRKININEESKIDDDANLPVLYKKSSLHDKIIDISFNSKKRIIKLIGEIKGKSISIKNNNDCIILIMEYSKSITIKNCENCSIFLAPCSSLILIEKCQNLNLISASLNLQIINVKNSNIFFFCSYPPLIEDSEDIFLGNFFFQYSELPEMFINSFLNIWNNKWSLYREEGINKNIKYSNDIIKQKFIESFKPSINECYITIDQFQFIPFTYGKSIIKEKNNFINFMIILRQEDFQENELLKILLPDELDNIDIKLISTLIIDKNSNKKDEIIKKLDLNKENNELINYILRRYDKEKSLESIQSIKLKSSFDRSRLNEIDISNNDCMNINFRFLKNDDLLLLWFVNNKINFDNIQLYFDSFLEPLNVYIINKDTFGWNEDEFQTYLKKIFEFEKP